MNRASRVGAISVGFGGDVATLDMVWSAVGMDFRSTLVTFDGENYLESLKRGFFREADAPYEGQPCVLAQD
jgi:hypothetical protein